MRLQFSQELKRAEFSHFINVIAVFGVNHLRFGGIFVDGKSLKCNR